jgi:hypothetical protein
VSAVCPAGLLRCSALCFFLYAVALIEPWIAARFAELAHSVLRVVHSLCLTRALGRLNLKYISGSPITSKHSGQARTAQFRWHIPWLPPCLVYVLSLLPTEDPCLPPCACSMC